MVGMSGGVDSSVAAFLLKEEGYEVCGMTLALWQDPVSRARACEKAGALPDAVKDAEAVCRALGISHEVVPFDEAFSERVVLPFREAYLGGRTPNPCILCNPSVKWPALCSYAEQTGASFVATGHYAHVRQLTNGRYALQKAATGKDQTYALYALTQEQLSITKMPLGAYEKSTVRRIAHEAGIPVAEKADSMEICFLPDGDYADYLARSEPARTPPTGDFVLPDGTIVGRHKGYTHYTIGQRKGLQLSLGAPAFVQEIDAEKNRVVVDTQDVYARGLVCERLSFMGLLPGTAGASFRANAKVRYAHAGAACTVTLLADDRAEVVFDAPVRAITPGQAVVFYDEEGVVLGGGEIVAPVSARDE